MSPSVEVRGTYPLSKGTVNSYRNILGGVRVGKVYERWRPYADLLFGRGAIRYTPPAVDSAGGFRYLQSVGNVLSLGGGVDLPVSDRFVIKLDGQVQHYPTPVTASRTVWAKIFEAGVVYRFGR